VGWEVADLFLWCLEIGFQGPGIAGRCLPPQVTCNVVYISPSPSGTVPFWTSLNWWISQLSFPSLTLAFQILASCRLTASPLLLTDRACHYPLILASHLITVRSRSCVSALLLGPPTGPVLWRGLIPRDWQFGQWA
jgi:hypothetical protein